MTCVNFSELAKLCFLLAPDTPDNIASRAPFADIASVVCLLSSPGVAGAGPRSGAGSLIRHRLLRCFCAKALLAVVFCNIASWLSLPTSLPTDLWSHRFLPGSSNSVFCFRTSSSFASSSELVYYSVFYASSS